MRDAGSGGKYAGRNSRTRSFSTVIPRVQPTRSAITVAGIVGTARQLLADQRLELIHR